MGLERQYAKELRRYVRQEMALLKSYVPEIVATALANGIRVDEEEQEPEDDSDWILVLIALLFSRITEHQTTSPAFIRGEVEQIFQRVWSFAEREYDRIAKSVFGSTNTPPIGYMQDIEKMRNIFLDQNLRLISSINSEIREALYYTLAQNAVMGVDTKALERQIRDFIINRTEISEKRAVLIGADQVGKLNSQMTQYLQQKDGVKEYIWRTMRDSRVRPTHRARDGQLFRWDSPPPDGHPGWPIRCRCVADPVFDTNKKGLQPRRNSFIPLSEDGIIKADKVMTGHKDPPKKFEPYGVIDKIEDNGHIYISNFLWLGRDNGEANTF